MEYSNQGWTRSDSSIFFALDLRILFFVMNNETSKDSNIQVRLCWHLSLEEKRTGTYLFSAFALLLDEKEERMNLLIVLVCLEF